MRHESYPPLTWVERSGLLCADTGGHGRYVIRQIATGEFMLRLNGQSLGMFDRLEDAKERAERGAKHSREVAAQEAAHWGGNISRRDVL
jgi:hypothetical protein